MSEDLADGIDRHAGCDHIFPNRTPQGVESFSVKWHSLDPGAVTVNIILISNADCVFERAERRAGSQKDFLIVTFRTPVQDISLQRLADIFCQWKNDRHGSFSLQNPDLTFFQSISVSFKRIMSTALSPMTQPRSMMA